MEAQTRAPSGYASFLWTFAHQQRTYRAEVIVAASWRPEFNGPLPGQGEELRLVLLTHPEAVPLAPHTNPRVLCITLTHDAPSVPAGPSTPASVREAAPPSGLVAQAQDDLLHIETFRHFLSISGAYLEAYCYTTEADIPPDHTDLAVDRSSLLAQLEPGYLIEHLDIWPSLSASFGWFRARYRALYNDHHKWYHQEVARSRALLVESEEQVEGLRRLNSITHLGVPLGTQAIQAWESALDTMAQCSQREEEEDFASTSPRCATCGASFSTPSPQVHARVAIAAIERALHLQLRRLSSETVHRVLASMHRPRLERFLGVLQASDVVSLVQVLDDDLTGFVRSLLSEAIETAAATKVLDPLREKFSVLEEEQIPAAVQEFERLLRHAADEARMRHPGSPVRLRLE